MTLVISHHLSILSHKSFPPLPGCLSTFLPSRFPDLKDLAALSVQTSDWKHNYPNSNSPSHEDLKLKKGEVYVLDTQRYFSALMQRKDGGRLGKMAESCEIENGMKMSEMKLHNAG